MDVLGFGLSPGDLAGVRPSSAPRVGVSSCLLGQEVRWNGGHKRDHLVTDGLGRHLELIPVCPEVELGLGAPREPVSLYEKGGSVRMLGNRTGIDLTGRMKAFARRRADELAAKELSGYVFKKDSPSCGLKGVRLHTDRGITKDGRGLFAAALIERFPHLPVIEETQLHDERSRESFIERVFAYRRLRDFFASKWTAEDLEAMSALSVRLRSH